MLCIQEVFENFTKDSLRCKAHRIPNNVLVRFRVKNGWILFRFSGKIEQIVSQILENFSQIQMISTLYFSNTLL